jgi:hypothetical protein
MTQTRSGEPGIITTSSRGGQILTICRPRRPILPVSRPPRQVPEAAAGFAAGFVCFALVLAGVLLLETLAGVLLPDLVADLVDEDLLEADFLVDVFFLTGSCLWLERVLPCRWVCVPTGAGVASSSLSLVSTVAGVAVEKLLDAVAAPPVAGHRPSGASVPACSSLAIIC